MDLVRASNEDRLYRCIECGGDQPFEQPPCEDDHGDDCPERACVTCGHAILVGSPATVPVDAASGAHVPRPTDPSRPAPRPDARARERVVA